MRAYMSDRTERVADSTGYPAGYPRYQAASQAAAEYEAQCILAAEEPTGRESEHVPLSQLGEVFVSWRVDGNAHAALYESLDRFVREPLSF